MIKTVIFDIGNVLTSFRWRGFIKDQGYSDEMVERIGNASTLTKEWSEFDRGVWTEEQIIESFIKHDPEIEEDLRKTYHNIHGMVSRRDYAIPWIQDLKKRDYQVLVLSNFSKKSEVECEDALDFLDYIDGGILSYQDHVVKPDRDIYELILSRYHLKADECVFLDDTQKNLPPAEALGIHTIWFQTKEQATEDLEKLLQLN